jgi:hypothetical protein
LKLEVVETPTCASWASWNYRDTDKQKSVVESARREQQLVEEEKMSDHPRCPWSGAPWVVSKSDHEMRPCRASNQGLQVLLDKKKKNPNT